MFNIYLGIYIVLSILLIAGGTYYIVNLKDLISAFIYFIGALIVLILFGLKWFSSGALFSSTPVQWPPTINTCPDYLVYYSRTMPDGSTQPSCIDTIGVSKNGALKVFPANQPVPTSNDYYFSLSTAKTDPASKNQELCQKAISMGLTWEGITNGESCVASSNHTSSSGSSGSSSGSPNCPSVW
jgi:hypothetical protein